MRIQRAKTRKRKADERYRKAVAKMRSNPARKKKVSLAPIAKVLRESGARRVQVMRSKSGKATGLKFLK